MAKQKYGRYLIRSQGDVPLRMSQVSIRHFQFVIFEIKKGRFKGVWKTVDWAKKGLIVKNVITKMMQTLPYTFQVGRENIHI